MDIASCFDHNYVMPQGIMMQSLCVNNKDVEIVFHLIIDESITLQDKDDLRDIAVEEPVKELAIVEPSIQLCPLVSRHVK